MSEISPDTDPLNAPLPPYMPRHAGDPGAYIYEQLAAELGFDPVPEEETQAKVYIGRHRMRYGRHAAVEPDPGYYGQHIPPEDIEEPAAMPPDLDVPESPPERVSMWGKVKQTWRKLGASAMLYFNHPEKGRRRQIVAVAAGYAALGAAAWLFSHHYIFGDRSAPPSAPTPHPAPAPSAPVAPPVEPQPQTYGSQFYDNLAPTGYHGETYEWGALADQVGPPYATPELLEMADHARAAGATVDIWGDPASSHWGISYVTVNLSDGSQATYYDTWHKLAILQYLNTQAPSS
jgi:hypothetical protein